ncbi:hypothetical protein [Hymenobacter ruricola]|uniref:DUF4239 domain-containing protein n=1 Tax=Hymenobacter ruricola TaxID=2791023 RepID=A0ABS0I3F9_9BACT|nr:hypothetical protein [Hymenobacter ruricola]MBF9221263.1 hypothetical protein [Hymenobacter ruricola]
MRFFPALTEVFTSPLPPAELLRRVQDSVQQARAFTGRVAAQEFTISRVIDYRNSMLPRIKGEVAAGPAGGSRVRLQHSLHPAVLAFAALWLGVVGSVVAAMGLALAHGDFRTDVEGPVGPALIPVGMLVVGLLLFTVPFWAEVRQSRPLLIELLQLAPVAEEAGG